MKVISLIGPTASGKTALAVQLARHLNREIVSGDSRQVYRGMNLGTGKDLEEYGEVPYHLIDIRDAGYKYNVFEYQKDFFDVYQQLEKRNTGIILCGGSGMYIDSVVNAYRMDEVPPDEALRQQLETKPHEELIAMLGQLRPLHNTSDTDSKKRTIRAIEIAHYHRSHPAAETAYPKLDNCYIAISLEQQVRWARIEQRLRKRLDEGMIEEVKTLLEKGIAPEDLIFYGLEYKFLTRHLIGELSYDEMFDGLNIAIRQFSKRQLTWIRSLERRGEMIHWIDGNTSCEEMFGQCTAILATEIR